MPDSLIICDGGVASLLACAIESDRSAHPIMWCPPSITAEQRAAVRRQSEFFGATHSPERIPNGDPGDPVESQLRMLLDAALVARARGGGEVIWPICTNPAPSGEGPDIETTARAVEQSLLVSQLVTLAGSGTPVRIRTPFADLTERQLADLILDMDLPVWLCSWWDGDASPEREKWSRLLREAGWAGPLQPPVVVPPRRTSPTSGDQP